MSQSDVRSRVQMAETAFIQAHGRFLAVHVYADEQPRYASLAETLFWIYALDDLYLGGLDRQGYEAHRNTDRYGRSVVSLRVARNAAAHEAAVLLESMPHRTSGEVTLEQPILKPEERLGLKRKPGTKASVEYARQQGRPVRYLLRDANYFFVRRASKLEIYLPA